MSKQSIKENKNNLSPMDFMREAGILFQINEMQIMTVDGIMIPKHKALVKHTEGQVDFVLGVVSDRYTVYSNDDLAEFAARVSQGTNAKITHGGFFRGGRDVFFQLDLGSEVFPFGDVVRQYASFRNNHNGNGSLHAFPSNMREICINTFVMSYRQFGHEGASFRHTTSIFERVDEFIDEVTNIRKEHTMFAEQAETLSRLKAQNAEDLLFVAEKIIGGSSKVQARNYLDLMISLDNPTNNNIRDTVWGTFNAVTHWGTHNRKLKKNSDRDFDSLFGVGGKVKTDTFNYLMQKYAA